jgi:hypothetical protein
MYICITLFIIVFGNNSLSPPVYLPIQLSLKDYWVFGLCPSSGILKKQKNPTFRKLDVFPSSGKGAGDTYSVGPVRKS